MWNTFKYTVLTLAKERTVLVWALAFPLILATLFSAMFADIDNASSFQIIPVAIVDDHRYEANESFSAMIEGLSEEGDDQVIETHFVPNATQARALCEEGTTLGYYLINDTDAPEVYFTSSNNLGMSSSINDTIIKNIADTYLRSRATIESLIEENPVALSDPSLLESFYKRESHTQTINITANQASGSVRYFYSLLGFAAILSAQISMIALLRTQGNLSALGARRMVGATSRAKTMGGTLLASWMLTFACLFIAYLYMRFVLGISFGDRDLASLVSILAASFMSTGLGAFIGTIPKLGEGAKVGILTGLSVLLALFAGLFGEASQALADEMARTAPLLQAMNPSKVVTDLFYSLYYYNTYDPFFAALAALLLLSAVMFVVAGIFMRRQRYASI